MKYIITDTNIDQGWVALTVTWNDETTYKKKMMVDLASEDTIHACILEWLQDYSPMRDAELEATQSAYDPSVLEGKTVQVSPADLEG